jgi:hypothetical protein
MNFVGKTMGLLKTQELHYHNLVILCTYYHLFFQSKFKLKPTWTIEMCSLLSPCFDYKM